ncbi:MAG: competence/damage-inducible protein A [Candidatus Geothermincolia bacterium]
MRCCIITVGDEILSGDIRDSNGPFISERLISHGMSAPFQITVGDREPDIAAALGWALDECDGVIITGGLGPTSDDLTREAVAAHLRRPLVVDPSIVESLERRFAAFGRRMSETNLKQAAVIEGAEVIGSVLGTAPGQMVVPAPGKLVALLPGVPAEMREMLERAVLPRLAEMADPGPVWAQRILRTIGPTESEVAERVQSALAGTVGLQLGFLASTAGIVVKIGARGASRPEAEAELDAAERSVRRELGAQVVGSGDETLEQVLGELLRQRRLTLAVAESLTGGMIGEALTRVPGSGDYFLGSVVCYSNLSKQELLGVPEGVLAEHGAVSAEVAAAMASGARGRFGSDIAISATGIAGPGGGTKEKPVGTVWLGLAAGEKTETRRILIPLAREGVRELTTTIILALLRAHLLGEEFGGYGS